MVDKPILPQRITALGGALRPVREMIWTHLARPVRAAISVHKMSEVITSHLQRQQALLIRLEERVNGLMTEVVGNESATERDVHRAVERLEAVVVDMLVGLGEVRALDALGQDAEARDLLAGVYRHTLAEILDWLDEVVQTLADPLAAARRRGLPMDGHVDLSLTLNVTPAPQLAALSNWAERQTASLAVQGTRASKTGLGFWGVGSALAFGWIVGDALFGDDDCGHGGGA